MGDVHGCSAALAALLRTVAAHRRRGHWHWQPSEPGRQERWRVAIPSVLVNAHRFLGAPGDTTTTYRMRN